VAVGGNHGEGLGLDDEERAVQRVTGFFIGNCKDGAGDERLERHGGDAGGGDGGELWYLGIVGAGHADHLGVGAAGADLHPVVVKELDGDVAVGEELDVVVKLAGGDGAGAGLFDFDLGAGADGLVEVSGGDVEAVPLGFDEEVGEDGDGGFALDDALRGGELLHQVLAAYGYFHRCPLHGRLDYFSFNDRHRPPLAQKPDCCAGHTLQHNTVEREQLLLLVFDCIHPDVSLRVENRAGSLDSKTVRAFSENTVWIWG